MERLRQAVIFTGQQLGKLTASQRLLIGSLAVMMLMALFVVQQYTGKPAMSPLFPNATAEEAAEIESFLQASNIEYAVQGSDIMVAPGRHRWVQAQLAQQGKLPADNTMYFEDMIEMQSWTKTTEQTRQMANVAKMNELSLIISNMDGITKASVLLDVPPRRGFGAADKAPTASITVFGRGINQDTVDAVADLVASSTAGLSLDNVRVIDGNNNRRFRARSDTDFGASSYNEHVAKTEAYIREKLLEMVSYIDGAKVTVHAQIDVTRQTKTTKAALPEDGGSIKLQKSSTASSQEQNEAREGGSPGVVSNTGASIQSGGGGGSSFEESDEQTSYDTMIGQEVQTIEDPKGHPLKINAVVNIPRSYFVRVYQESGFAAAGGGDDDGGGEDGEADGGAGPDDAALAPVRDAEIARITAEVQSVVDMTAKADGMAGEVLVSMIPLVPEGLATGVAGAGGGSFLTASSGPMSLPNIAKTVSIGLLAVLALGMVLYTTLRANRREALPTAEELVGVPPTFDDDSSILGEAGEAQSALAGIELDDAELAVRKMRDQISEMVQERPARAASLVGHWVGDVG